MSSKLIVSSNLPWRSEWRIPPAKIDVSQPGKSVLETLTDLYSLYGPIASIRSLSDLISTVGFGYVFIELMDGRYAEVAIINDKIKNQYRIVPDVPTSRNDSQLPSMNFNGFPRSYLQSPPSNPPPPISNEHRNSPESDSNMNILNKLNDLDLQKIFSYLSLADLCSVADVCTMFRANAKETFAKRFGTPEIDDVVRFESLARNFGTMIQSLSINCWSCPAVSTEIRKNAMLSILVKYFSGPYSQLKSLHLTKIDIDARWHKLLAPIFCKLEYLRLDGSQISELLCCCNNVNMMDLCTDVGQFTENNNKFRVLDNLERLTLWETTEWRDILFRQLEFGEKMLVLKIQDSDMEHNFQTICNIFDKFPNLEELHVSTRLRFSCLGPEGRNKMLAIFKRMINLTTLSLNITDPVRFSSVQPFFGLSGFLNVLAEAHLSLQQLKIGSDVSYAELNCISRLALLKSLTINGMVLASIPMINMINKLHQLTELRLLGQKNPGYWKKDDIKEIVHNGKHLCLLYFGCWREELIIYENDCSEILYSIRFRIPKTKLTIIIRTTASVTFAVAPEKMAMLSDFLEFKVVTLNE